MKEIISGILNMLGGISGLAFYILDEISKLGDKDLMLYINILIVLFLLMLNIYRLSKLNDKPFYKSLYVLLISSLLVTITGYTVMHITTVFSSVNIVGGIIMIVYTLKNKRLQQKDI